MLCRFVKTVDTSEEKRVVVSSDMSRTTTTSMLNFDGLDGQHVVVTHIETPEKFFSRLVTDESEFTQMNELIWDAVRSPFAEELDCKYLESDAQVLAFSTIHQIWCRGLVEEVPKPVMRGRKANQKPSVKVRLIDFGSVEVVASENLRQTTDEINGYNYGNSFCFECRLTLIKPISDTQEWSSYANYLFEKQVKDNLVSLRLDEYRDGVVVCDLMVQYPNDCHSQLQSMSDFLVQTRVALYRMGHDYYHRSIPLAGPEGESPNAADFDYDSDEELNRHDFDDQNTLYYIWLLTKRIDF